MLENFAKEKEALEANLRQGFEKEKQAALEAKEAELNREFDATMRALVTDTEQKLEASTRNIAEAMGKTQAAYELYEQVYIQHYNLEKDMKNMVADHEEQMLSKEAEFQLELTKKAAENAKALQELHDVHMASMKTQEVGYEERLRKKRRQVQALMDQVTDVNNFVQEYYQKYNLANYRPREPMGNQGQAGLGIVAAMFLERFLSLACCLSCCFGSHPTRRSKSPDRPNPQGSECTHCLHNSQTKSAQEAAWTQEKAQSPESSELPKTTGQHQDSDLPSLFVIPYQTICL